MATGTAVRGRRIALRSNAEGKGGREVIGYVCGAKPLLFGHFTLTDGVEVPGATRWTRLEAWVSARRIRPVYEGDDFTAFDEFVEQILTAAQDEAYAEHWAREIAAVWDEAHAQHAARTSAPAAPEQSEEDKATAAKARRQAAAAKAREAKQAKKAAATKE